MNRHKKKDCFANADHSESVVIPTQGRLNDVLSTPAQSCQSRLITTLLHCAYICCMVVASGCTDMEVHRKCAKLTDSMRDLGTCKRIEDGLVTGTTLDWERDHFRVRRCSRLTIGVTQKTLPIDLLAYGLTHIIGIEKSYPYFDRIVRSTQAGINQSGCAFVDTYERSRFHAAMISLSKENVVMFRYMGPEAVVHYDRGQDIDIVEKIDNAK